MSELEYCCNCDEPTGNAGRYDDSIYIEALDGEYGPLCEECHLGFLRRAAASQPLKFYYTTHTDEGDR